MAVALLLFCLLACLRVSAADPEDADRVVLTAGGTWVIGTGPITGEKITRLDGIYVLPANLLLPRPAAAAQGQGKEKLDLLARVTWTYTVQRPSGAGGMNVANFRGDALRVFRARPQAEGDPDYNEFQLLLDLEPSEESQRHYGLGLLEEYLTLTEKTMPLQGQLDLTFVSPGAHRTAIVSYLAQDWGYAGGAHSFFGLKAHTVVLGRDGTTELRLADIFADPAKWPELRPLLVAHLGAIWDKAAADVAPLEGFHLVLADDDLGDTPFLVTIGRQGVCLHLVFDGGYVGSFAFGGAIVTFPAAELPPELRAELRDEFVPRPLPELPEGVQPAQLNTAATGVFPQFRVGLESDGTTGPPIIGDSWFIGSFLLPENGVLGQMVYPQLDP